MSRGQGGGGGGGGRGVTSWQGGGAPHGCGGGSPHGLWQRFADWLVPPLVRSGLACCSYYLITAAHSSSHRAGALTHCSPCAGTAGLVLVWETWALIGGGGS